MRIPTLGVTAVLLMSFGGLALAGEFYTKDKVNKPRGVPEDGMALVYVYRPANMGAAIKTWAFADEQFLGVSKANAYYYAQVPAGTHIFWAKAENTSGLEVEVKAGETYYFKTAIRMGFGKARVKIVQIDEATAEGYFDQCGYVEPTAEGRQRAVEIAAERHDRAIRNAEKKKNRG